MAYLSIIYLSLIYFLWRERERERFFFLEEFTHVITGTGKSEICIAGQQAARLGKVDISLWSLKSAELLCCKFQAKLLFWGTSVFAFKVFNQLE